MRPTLGGRVDPTRPEDSLREEEEAEAGEALLSIRGAHLETEALQEALEGSGRLEKKRVEAEEKAPFLREQKAYP